MQPILNSVLLNSVLLACLLALSHGLLKWASARSDGTFFGLIKDYWAVLFAALTIYGFIFFYYAYVLRFVRLSTLYPLYTGFSIVLVFASGVLFFSESVSWANIAGCALICAGLFLVYSA